MKLFLLTQDAVNGYSTYDSAVVAAPDEATAKTMHPNGYHVVGHVKPEELYYGMWPDDPALINAKLIGETVHYKEPCVICASFNAG